MSTQLYSSWLTTTIPQCYLSVSVPPRVNLPPEYQPNLEYRLRELSVDFSLEKTLLEKAKNSVQVNHIKPTPSRNLEPNSLLQPELVNQVKPSLKSTELSCASVIEEKPGSSSLAIVVQTNLDPLLNQFDTLNLQSNSTSDEIQQQLAELFSTTSKLPSLPNHIPQSSPISGTIPSHPRKEFPHNLPRPSGDLYSGLLLHPHKSNPMSHQIPYTGFHPVNLPTSLSENSVRNGNLGQSKAPPLPPPNPLPKPLILSATDTLTMNSDLDASLSQLVFMGFSQESALHALQTNGGNLDQAIEALLSGQL